MKKFLPGIVTLLLAWISFGAPTSIQAELRLSGIFSDHMVLQREQPVQVWGWAEKRQQVTVRFAGRKASTTASADGSWQVTFKPFSASAEGRDLAVSCNSEPVLIRDVVVGDVWHASGQSNMAMTVTAVARRLPQAREDMEAARLPAIRFRRISENESDKPLFGTRMPSIPSTAISTIVPGCQHRLSVPIPLG